jgi:hypothetical protein
VAVNFCEAPAGTLAVDGDTLTFSGGSVSVTAAVADFVPSVTEVAVSVTLAGFGSEVGAV